MLDPVVGLIPVANPDLIMKLLEGLTVFLEGDNQIVSVFSHYQILRRNSLTEAQGILPGVVALIVIAIPVIVINHIPAVPAPVNIDIVSAETVQLVLSGTPLQSICSGAIPSVNIFRIGV